MTKIRLERADWVGNQIRWSPRFVRQLGKFSDVEIAVRMGVSLTAVVHERRRRKIPPFRLSAPPVVWTPEMDSLLGEAYDSEVAAELGISKGSVYYRRQLLGIPPSGPKGGPRRIDRYWTAARVALLGTAVDGDVARALRTTRPRVATERRRRGIAPFQARRPKVKWTAAMVRQLGKVSDKRIAKRFGIGEDTVRGERNRRKIPPLKNDSWMVLRKTELRKLLRLPTEEVARRTGLNVKTVFRLRADLGVPNPGYRTAWNEKTLSLLGKVPDEELARRLGLKVHTVRLQRNRQGIKYRVTRRWSDREIEIVRRYSLEVAARRTRRTPKAIRHMRARLGLD